MSMTSKALESMQSALTHHSCILAFRLTAINTARYSSDSINHAPNSNELQAIPCLAEGMFQPDGHDFDMVEKGVGVMLHL